MTDHAWKKFERRVARAFGGERRGPDNSDGRRGKTDTIGTPGFAIECGLGRTYTTYAAIRRKVEQCERNANPDEMPIAVLKAPGLHDANALVVMRLPTFLEWHGPSGPEPPHGLDCLEDET